jgi:hypothetical protein
MPDRDPRPLNFEYPARDCPFCGEDLPCPCSAVQMFGEDYDIQARHYHKEFRVDSEAVNWLYGGAGVTEAPDTPDGEEEGG